MFLNQKLELASNPNTSPEILAELAEDENLIVRTKVANNPNTSAATLDQLIRDKDCVVRYGAIDNPSIQLSTLEMLVKTQGNYSFRAKRAYTRAFSQEIQDIKDQTISVEELTVFSKSSNFIIREAIAGSAKTPMPVLKAMANDEVWCVRQAVAQNLNTPVEALIKLAKDSSQDVRQALECSLRTRSGVRRILATNPNNLSDNSLEIPAIVVGLMVALELDYLNFESATSWADRFIEHSEEPNTWIVEISVAKSLEQIYEILRKSGYYESQLEAELYIGLSCIPWMGTLWLRESLSSYTFLDKMRVTFMDAMEIDESYSKLYYALDRLASSDTDHHSIQGDEDFIEAQKQCFQLCEKAKRYLSLFLNEI